MDFLEPEHLAAPLNWLAYVTARSVLQRENADAREPDPAVERREAMLRRAVRLLWTHLRTDPIGRRGKNVIRRGDVFYYAARRRVTAILADARTNGAASEPTVDAVVEAIQGQSFYVEPQVRARITKVVGQVTAPEPPDVAESAANAATTVIELVGGGSRRHQNAVRAFVRERVPEDLLAAGEAALDLVVIDARALANPTIHFMLEVFLLYGLGAEPDVARKWAMALARLQWPTAPPGSLPENRVVLQLPPTQALAPDESMARPESMTGAPPPAADACPLCGRSLGTATNDAGTQGTDPPPIPLTLEIELPSRKRE